MIFRFEPNDANASADFSGFAEQIERFLESRPVPMATVSQVMIAIDEVVSNALNYGSGLREDCDGSTAELVVSIEIENGKVLAEVADNSAAFDPLSLPEPDTEASVEERDYGGLGVHIVRNLMDEVEYLREEGWNRLRFSKTFEVE
ncbi:MAG: ATP-binding protein [Erythrobacter sp.]